MIASASGKATRPTLQAALEAVRQNRGATSRTIEMILPHLTAQGLYIAPETSEEPGMAAPPSNPLTSVPLRPATSTMVVAQA